MNKQENRDKGFRLLRPLKKPMAMSLALLLGLTACGSTKDPAQAPSPLAGKEVLALAAPLEVHQHPEASGKYDEKLDEAYREFWDRLDKEVQESKFKDPLYRYTEKMNRILMSEGKDNVVYSPLNTYMCLSVLAEAAGGKTQEEILQALALDSPETNRQNSRAMTEIFNYDDGLLHIQSANAVWMNEAVKARQEGLESINKDFRASLFQGMMGSAEMDKLLQNWLKENTGGLLDDQANEETLNPNTVFALTSTLYFKGAWNEVFEKAMTKDETFHGVDGDQTVPFIHAERTDTIYQGKTFDALSLSFGGPARLWIIRPKDGDFDALTQSPDLTQLLSDPDNYPNQATCDVRMALPKLDLTNKFSLVEVMEKLGIREAFDSQKADFTGLLTPETPAFLTEASHATRFKMDEEGAEAAAYTIMKTEMAMEIPDKVYDFNADRPFLFVLTAFNESPLMVGRVNSLK